MYSPMMEVLHLLLHKHRDFPQRDLHKGFRKYQNFCFKWMTFKIKYL